MPQSCNIGHKSHAENVDIVNRSRRMIQPQDIAGTGTPGEQRLRGVFDNACAGGVLGEIAKKRIPRAEGEKTQRRNLLLGSDRTSLRLEVCDLRPALREE